MSTPTPLQEAIRQTRLGRRVIPVPYKSKGLHTPGWQSLRIEEPDLPRHFNGALGNIGLLTGEPSGGLTDLDLDADEAVRLAPHFLPETGLVSGRASRPRSHAWYTAEPLLATTKFRDPTKPERDERSMLVELRSTGCQTIVYPSVHPGGELVRWESDGEPARVEGDELVRCASRLAAAALLARHWPGTGSRQDAALALAGGLLRGGWSEDEVGEFIRAVAAVAGDEESRKRAEAAEYTRKRIVAGSEATGWPTLAEQLGERVVDRVREWLGMRTGSASRSADAEGPGLVKSLADAILETGHFAQDAGGKLYVFAGGAYAPTGQAHVRRRVKELLGHWRLTSKWSSHRADEVAEYIRVDAPALWERPRTDAVSLKNGLFYLPTGQLFPHDPRWLSPIQLPVAYDPEATCPAWEQFVAEVFPSDAHEIAWQIPADLMTPDRSDQRAVLLLGEGANGKSTYLTALLAFLGKQNAAGVALHRLEADRFAAARLLGKLANICPDLPSAHLAGTSMFKALTGGDRIAAEYKYRDSFEFEPFARLVFSANHPPRSEDASHAFFRRWLVVPFTRTFEGNEKVERRVLDARLADPAELSGVLNKALAALPVLRADGFLEAESMREAWVNFRQATDPLAVWLDQATVDRPDAYVARDALRRAYYAHCMEKGKPTLSDTAFGLAFKRLRPDVSDGQRTIAGGRVWCYIGVGLLETPGRAQGAQSAQGFSTVTYRGAREGPESQEEEEGVGDNSNGNPVHPVHPVQAGGQDAQEPIWLREADYATRQRWYRDHSGGDAA